MSKFNIDLRQEITVEFCDEKKAHTYLIDQGNDVTSFTSLKAAAEYLSVMASADMEGEHYNPKLNRNVLHIEGFGYFELINSTLVLDDDEIGMIKISGDTYPEPF